MSWFTGLKWKREAIMGTGVLLVLAGVFAAGRWTAPKPPAEIREVVKVVEKEVTRAGTSAASSAVVQRSEAASTRVVTRIVTKPGGERVVERWRDSSSNAQAQASTAEVRIEYRDRYVTKEAEATKVTITPQTRFTLTAIYGKTWDWRTEAGGVLSVRVAGPFTLSVWGTNRAAGVGAGVSW